MVSTQQLRFSFAALVRSYSAPPGEKVNGLVAVLGVLNGRVCAEADAALTDLKR